MTTKDFWLKLFNENDVALASAIILCERFVDDNSLLIGKDYIENKVTELYEEMSDEIVELVFDTIKGVANDKK